MMPPGNPQPGETWEAALTGSEIVIYANNGTVVKYAYVSGRVEGLFETHLEDFGLLFKFLRAPEEAT